MPNNHLQEMAAIMAESTALLDSMIAANLEADKAFIRGDFHKYLTAHIKSAKEALGITDGEPDEPDAANPTDVAGEPPAEMGEAEAG